LLGLGEILNEVLLLLEIRLATEMELGEGLNSVALRLQTNAARAEYVARVFSDDELSFAPCIVPCPSVAVAAPTQSGDA